MSFSFCLNKNELLVLAGFGLLFQGLDLNRKGKLIQDSQKLISSIVEILERNGAPSATNFTNLASVIISIDRGPKPAPVPKADTFSRRKSDVGMAAPKTGTKSARKQLQAFASRFSSNSSRTVKQVTKQESKNARRLKESGPVATNPILYDRSESQSSNPSVVSEPTGQLGYSNSVTNMTSPCQIAPLEQPNLEFLSFNHDLMTYSNVTPMASGTQFKDFDPESLAGYLGPHQQQGPTYENLFHSPPEVVSTYISPSPSSATYDWSSDVWRMPSDLNTQPGSAQSVLSFSEEEVTSGEELSSCDAGGDYRGILMPHVDGYGRLEGFERFGL